jgi:transposase
MAKRFLTCSLEQPYLLPPSPSDWLPESHLARFVAELIGELDLSTITGEYGRRDGRGKAAYHPEMMVRLLLYAYCTGQTSSRKIEEATYVNVAYRYLAANQQPDHDTLATFRKQHLKALADLFIQVLRLCQEAGLVKLGHVALDGTKIKANASRHQSVSYERLGEQEKQWQQTVEELLAKAEKTDAAEDEQFGVGKRDEALPEKLAKSQERLAAIRAAKAALEQRAQSKQEEIRQATPPPRPRGRPKTGAGPTTAAEKTLADKHRRKRNRARKESEQPTSTYNYTDPDSRLMKDGATKAFVQAYNAQAAVDEQAQIVVAASLTQEANDKEQLAPLLAEMQRNMGVFPTVASADTGYWNTEFIDQYQAQTKLLVPPEALKNTEIPVTAPKNDTAQAMRERLKTEEGKAEYKRRSATVEPVFGQIKQARHFRQFSLRGVTAVAAEWQLVCLTHNLLKLARHRRALTSPVSAPPGTGSRSSGQSSTRQRAFFAPGIHRTAFRRRNRYRNVRPASSCRSTTTNFL